METLRFFKSHYTSLPHPTKKITNQTIIITGSNTGLGLEAARHFVRLDAAKVILAIRSISKGETAAASISASEKRPGVLEVWELDLASWFAERVKSLERLDVVVENAGVFVYSFSMAQGDERTITVNVVSQFLLGLLLMPKLRETAVMHDREAVLTFVGSFVHWLTSFPERKAKDVSRSWRARKRQIYMTSRSNTLPTPSLPSLHPEQRRTNT